MMCPSSPVMQLVFHTERLACSTYYQLAITWYIGHYYNVCDCTRNNYHISYCEDLLREASLIQRLTLCWGGRKSQHELTLWLRVRESNLQKGLY